MFPHLDSIPYSLHSKHFLKDPVAVPCSHTFCRSCLDDHMSDNSHCPECEHPVYPKDVRSNRALKSVLDSFHDIHRALRQQGLRCPPRSEISAASSLTESRDGVVEENLIGIKKEERVDEETNVRGSSASHQSTHEPRCPDSAVGSDEKHEREGEEERLEEKEAMGGLPRQEVDDHVELRSLKVRRDEEDVSEKETSKSRVLDAGNEVVVLDVDADCDEAVGKGGVETSDSYAENGSDCPLVDLTSTPPSKAGTQQSPRSGLVRTGGDQGTERGVMWYGPPRKGNASTWSRLMESVKTAAVRKAGQWLNRGRSTTHTNRSRSRSSSTSGISLKERSGLSHPALSSSIKGDIAKGSAALGNGSDRDLKPVAALSSAFSATSAPSSSTAAGPSDSTQTRLTQFMSQQQERCQRPQPQDQLAPPASGSSGKRALRHGVLGSLTTTVNHNLTMAPSKRSYASSSFPAPSSAFHPEACLTGHGPTACIDLGDDDIFEDLFLVDPAASEPHPHPLPPPPPSPGSPPPLASHPSCPVGSMSQSGGKEQQKQLGGAGAKTEGGNGLLKTSPMSPILLSLGASTCHKTRRHAALLRKEVSDSLCVSPPAPGVFENCMAEESGSAVDRSDLAAARLLTQRRESSEESTYAETLNERPRVEPILSRLSPAAPSPLPAVPSTSAHSAIRPSSQAYSVMSDDLLAGDVSPHRGEDADTAAIMPSPLPAAGSIEKKRPRMSSTDFSEASSASLLPTYAPSPVPSAHSRSCSSTTSPVDAFLSPSGDILRKKRGQSHPPIQAGFIEESQLSSVRRTGRSPMDLVVPSIQAEGKMMEPQRGLEEMEEEFKIQRYDEDPHAEGIIYETPALKAHDDLLRANMHGLKDESKGIDSPRGGGGGNGYKSGRDETLSSGDEENRRANQCNPVCEEGTQSPRRRRRKKENGGGRRILETQLYSPDVMECRKSGLDASYTTPCASTSQSARQGSSQVLEETTTAGTATKRPPQTGSKTNGDLDDGNVKEVNEGSSIGCADPSACRMEDDSQFPTTMEVCGVMDYLDGVGAEDGRKAVDIQARRELAEVSAALETQMLPTRDARGDSTFA